MTNKSKIQFRVQALIALAKLCEPDDQDQRQRYMDEAYSILQESQTLELNSEKQSEIVSIIREIERVASGYYEYMTVSEFMLQDRRLSFFDPSLVGRMLCALGYNNVSRHIRDGDVRQQRLRYLPKIKNKEENQ